MNLLAKAIFVYTFNSPIRKGKYRLTSFAARFSNFPQEVTAKTTDGRKLFVNPRQAPYLYFLGEYEYEVTQVISSIVRKNDICLDVGANMGWYTTLLQKNVGLTGQVHAFEPIPSTFELLKRNVLLNGDGSNVILNNVSLGEKEGRVELHIFKGLSHGHTSFSTYGRDDYTTVESPLTALNTYLEKNDIRQVDFIKVDIEGAELQFLKGATSVFKQEIPPIFMIEMALATTKSQGYLPNDLIVFIRQHADYEFYAIDESKYTLKKIEGFGPDDIGANVLCVPTGKCKERISKLKIEP